MRSSSKKMVSTEMDSNEWRAKVKELENELEMAKLDVQETNIKLAELNSCALLIKQKSDQFEFELKLMRQENQHLKERMREMERKEQNQELKEQKLEIEGKEHRAQSLTLGVANLMLVEANLKLSTSIQKAMDKVINLIVE